MSLPTHMHHYEWGFISLTINDETGSVGIHLKLFPGKPYKSSGRWTWHPWGEVGK